MKWKSTVLSWPIEWSVCQTINESETVAQVCERLGHFVGKVPALAGAAKGHQAHRRGAEDASVVMFNTDITWSTSAVTTSVLAKRVTRKDSGSFSGGNARSRPAK